jgi:hypothetical protein
MGEKITTSFALSASLFLVFRMAFSRSTKHRRPVDVGREIVLAFLAPQVLRALTPLDHASG